MKVRRLWRKSVRYCKGCVVWIVASLMLSESLLLSLPAFGQSVSPAPEAFLGVQGYCTYLPINLGGGLVASANLGTGNLVVQKADLSVSGRGLPNVIVRTYNSQSSDNGAFGYGWTISANYSLEEKLGGSIVLTDGDGSRHTFTKNEDGSYQRPQGIYLTLKKHTDGTYSVKTNDGTISGFDSEGRLTRIQDKNGNALTYNYNDAEKLSTVIDSSSRITRLFYNSDGQLSRITDSTERVTSYAYDSSGNLTKVTDPMGFETSYEHDSSHNLTSVTDANDHTTSFAYTNGKVTSITDALDHEAPINHGTEDTRATDAKGNTTTYVFNENGSCTSVTDPLGNVANFVHDQDYNVVSSTSPNGTSSSAYDSSGNLTSKTDSLGQATQFAYDAKHNLISQTDAKGNRTTFAYDSKGNLATRTNPLGQTTEYSYDTDGLLVSASDPKGFVSYEYDEFGNAISKTDGLGNTTSFKYDAVGNLIAATDPSGSTARCEYDVLNRVIKATDPLGNAETYTYDPLGNVKSKTNPKGTTYDTYDALNQLIKVRDALGNETTTAYDEVGNQISVVAPNGAETTYEYDANRRMVSKTDASGTIHYSYDAAGNIKSETDAEGNATTYEYDVLGRPVKTTFGDNKTIEYSYDKNGNVTSKTDEGGITQYSYDQDNNIIKTTEPDGEAVENGYDGANNSTTVTDENGTVAYSRDAVERLTKLVDQDGGIASFDFDSAGRRTTLRNANGATTSYTYDQAGRLSSVKTETSTGNSLQQFVYTHDQLGNILTEETDSGKETYGYDTLGQLTRWIDKNSQATTYAYDEVGNLTSQTDSEGTTTCTYYPQTNQLLSKAGPAGNITYEYDANGSLTSKTDSSGTWTYSWNARNQLESVVRPDATTVSFAYDSEGMRKSKTVDGKTTYYDYDGIQLIAEKDSSGETIASYLYDDNDQLISVKRANETYCYHLNARGDVVAITDSSQDIVAAYSYDPWGRIISSSGSFRNDQPFRYAGYFWDVEIGMYYLINRYYDAEVQRFISKDELASSLLEPLDQNRYAYCKNDPVNFSDPEGLARMFISDGFVCSMSLSYAHLCVPRPIEGRRNYFTSPKNPFAIIFMNSVINLANTDDALSDYKYGMVLALSFSAFSTLATAPFGGAEATIISLAAGAVTPYMPYIGAMEAFRAGDALVRACENAMYLCFKAFACAIAYDAKMKRYEAERAAAKARRDAQFLQWLSAAKASGGSRNPFYYRGTGLRPPGYPPGGDWPDETYSVSSINSSNSSVAFRDSQPQIAVLKQGYPEGFVSLMEKYREKVKLVDMNFDPYMVNQYPMLVLPTGGLYGLESSNVFKARLEQYVKNGGTLVCFSQQHGREFGALPGGQVSGYGWIEDASCQGEESSLIENYHPSLAGLASSAPNIHVDGFFTKYPEDTTVLLRRKANDMPSMITYPYGDGQVVASTVFPDWAYGMNQATSDEMALIRDLVSWAVDPISTARFKPGDSIDLELQVANETDLSSTKVELKLLDPDRKVINTETKDLNLAPGETKNIAFNYTAPTTLGIYLLDYVLKDSGGNIIQPQAQSERFAVSETQISEAKDISFAITSDAEYYSPGSDAIFTIHIWNKSAQDKPITIKAEPWARMSFASLNKEVTVPANDDVEANIIAKTLEGSYGGVRASFYEGTRSLGATERRVWITNPSTNISINMGEQVYKRGDTASAEISLQNKASSQYNGSLKTTVISPSGEQIIEKNSTFTLTPNQTVTKPVSFLIPSDAEFGTYRVYAQALFDGNKIGAKAVSFDVPRMFLRVTPQDVPPLVPMADNTVQLKVENIGVVDVQGDLALKLSNPAEEVVWSGSQPISLLTKESNTLDFQVPFGEANFGVYGLDYEATYDGKSQKSHLDIPCSIAVKPNVDKASYRIRENMNLNVGLTNNGKFVANNMPVEIEIPDIGFSQTQMVSLDPGQTSSLPLALALPDTLSAGQHDVIVTAKLANSVSKTANFSIPESKLNLILEKTDYNAGDNLTVKLTNEGGVDTSYDCPLKLIDAKGLKIVNQAFTGEILAGEIKDIILAIPSQATSGSYRVVAECLDTQTGDTVHFAKSVEINGLSASMTAQTDRGQYLGNETIATLASVNNQDGDIKNGLLNLQAVQGAGFGEGEYQFIKAWPRRIWKFNVPIGMAIDSLGNFYVADSGNHRIQKFDSEGNFITKWGRYGLGDGEFDSPWDVAIDSLGNVYVADRLNHRIQKFDSEGNFLTKWGSYGLGDGEFDSPWDVAIDSLGNVYVADTLNHRIQKFDSEGNFLTKWGSYGSGDGEFEGPNGIAVDSSGYVYVTDAGNHRIQKFDSEGNFLTKWGSYGSGDGEFINGPLGIAVDSLGNVYVTDAGSYRIQKFDSEGNFMTKWGSYGSGDGKFRFPFGIAIDSLGNVYVTDADNSCIQKFDSEGNFVTKWGSYGLGDGEFYLPSGIAVASSGCVYVTDAGNHRIQKFDSEGNFVTKWGSYGSGDGEFYLPLGVAVDSLGNVYVADADDYEHQTNGRIQKFDSEGNFVTKWGSYGSGDGEFYRLRGIAVDSSGYVYVGDAGNDRIQKFDSEGNFINKWGSYGSGDGEFEGPYGIAIDSVGNVYVTDSDSCRIQKFDSEGAFLTKWGSYGSGDGEFINGPLGIAVDSLGNVYVTDAGNCRVQKFGCANASAKSLWQKDIPISLAAGGTSDVTEEIGVLNTSGKLYLKSVLKSSTGQVIAEDSYPFYIFRSNSSLTMQTDKNVYKPGETITITGVVKNDAEIPLLDKTIAIFSDTESVYTELVPILNPGETRNFSFTVLASKTFNLKGFFDDVEVTDFVAVSQPTVEMSAEAPEVVGRGDFSIDVMLKNTGKVDANLNLAVRPRGESSEGENLVQGAGETKLIQKRFQIDKDTTFDIVLSGDVNETVSKEVHFGEDASVAPTPQDIYLEGSVSVPYLVANTGQLETGFDLTFSLNGNSIIEPIYLPKGTSIEDTLYLGTLSAGDYALAYSTPFENGSVSFKVVKRDQVNMNVAVYDDLTGLLLPLPPDVQGQIAVYTELTNVGYNDFEGTLLVDTDFDKRETEVALQRGETKPALLLLDPQAATPGTHEVKITLLNSSGSVVQEVTKSVEVRAPSFEVVSAPSNPSFDIGELAHMSFAVKNTGSLEGEAILNLDVVGIDQQTKSVWIKPGETSDVTFDVPIPDDLEEKDYKASFALGGGEPQELTFQVRGVKVSVEASLDKEFYASGDTATLSLQIHNENSLSGLGMYTKAQLGDKEDSKQFTLDTNQTITLNLPVSEGDERLSYGIYMASGRAIYLNSLYVRAQDDMITLVPDKQVYLSGETVNVAVQAEQAGTLKVVALNYSQDIDVVGATSFSFALPEELKSGTYTIDYSFNDVSGSVPIDVRGYSAKVLECELNKATYAPQDTVKAKFKIEANRDFRGVLKGWIYDPQGEYTEAFQVERDFVAGENPVEATANLSTNQAGIHRLVYGIYKTSSEILLASGQESFDVEGVTLVSLSTDKIDYLGVEEPVVANIGTFGHGQATLSLYVDDQLASEQVITVDGYQNSSISLVTVQPGIHTLRGRLANGVESEKSCGFVFGSNLPDLTANPDDVSFDIKPLLNGSGAYLTAAVSNMGKTDANNVVVRFYNGDPATGGIQIGSDQVIPIVPAKGTGSAQVLLTDPALNGEHLIYVVIDPENTVVEFSESNNQASKLMDIEVDITPPTTSISVGNPRYGTNPVYVTPATEFNLSATDEVSGVASTEYKIDGGDWTPYAAPFEVSGEGPHTISCRSTDKAGNVEQTRTLDIYVDNTPPSNITISSPSAFGIYQAGYVYFEFLALDEQGGSGVKGCTATLDGGTPFMSPNILTLGAGVCNLVVSATDNIGNVATKQIMFVVYDPTAGFVTGGGWINSPEGSYTANPTLTGKATFGFVSKYQKGVFVPTGQTEFQFSVADLNFHSENYEWLVIAGAGAKYKGSGTINGQGGYKFMLTAIDGQITGSGSIDKFRIKIWNEVTGNIVYDNKLGASDTGYDATELGGGSVVIRKK